MPKHRPSTIELDVQSELGDVFLKTLQRVGRGELPPEIRFRFAIRLGDRQGSTLVAEASIRKGERFDFQYDDDQPRLWVDGHPCYEPKR
jgi:hypothetical protein